MEVSELSLEEVSNRNLVAFYHEELANDDHGELSVWMRTRMHKLGILEMEGKRPSGLSPRGNRLVLSEYGLRLLEEVKKNE